MSKPFQKGDYVQWKPPTGMAQTGNIEQIDRAKGTMTIWIGTFPNHVGGCRVTVGAERKGRHWLAHRSFQGYRERITRVKKGQL